MIGRALVFVMSLFVAGCSFEILPLDVQKAEKLCANNGGWAEIEVSGVGTDVTCEDGAWYSEYVLYQTEIGD